MKVSNRSLLPLMAAAAGLLTPPQAHSVPYSCGDAGIGGWFSTISEQSLRANWNKPFQGVDESFLPPDPEGKGPIWFALSERHVDEDFLDYLEIEVEGLSLGQSIRLERYLVGNEKGIINDNSVLLDSRLLTDGFLPLTGAEPNYNETLDYIEIDLEAVTFRDGEIYSYFPIRSGFESIPGEYVYRISSPSGAFEPQTEQFTISTVETKQYYTGRVLQGDSPIAGAWVGLLQPVGDGQYGHLRKVAVSDEDGRYTLYAPHSDEFDLVAVAPGFVGPFSIGTGESIDEGEIIERDLQLISGSRTLSGTIIDSVTEQPIPGLPVTFLSSNPAGQPDGSLFTHTWTDSEGGFSVTVSPGTWGITFKPSDVSSRSYVTGLERAVATVDLSTADVKDLVVPLTRGTCLITGTLSSTELTDEDGEPLPMEGIEIFAFDEEHGWAASGVTYEDGWFNLAVPPGRWIVFPFSYDLEASHHPGSTRHDVFFTAEDQSIELDVKARPADGVLDGFVTHTDTSPVGRLRLTAFNTTLENEESVIQTSYESNGYYNFFLGSGDWSIFPDAASAAERNLLFVDLPHVQIPANGTAFQGNRHSLPIRTRDHTGTMDWSLKDLSGSPLPNVKVHAMMTDSSGTVYDAFGRTNTEGIAHIPVVDGRWELHASIFDLGLLQKQELPVLEVVVAGNRTPASQTALDYINTSPILTPVRGDDDREFYLTGRGEPGRRYLIEGSHDLSEWLTLGLVTAVEGEFSITDHSNQASDEGLPIIGSTFYRVTPRDRN